MNASLLRWSAVRVCSRLPHVSLAGVLYDKSARSFTSSCIQGQQSADKFAYKLADFPPERIRNFAIIAHVRDPKL